MDKMFRRTDGAVFSRRDFLKAGLLALLSCAVPFSQFYPSAHPAGERLALKWKTKDGREHGIRYARAAQIQRGRLDRAVTENK